MIKSQVISGVGDTKSPTLAPSEKALREGVDQAFRITAEPADALKVMPALSSLELSSSASNAGLPAGSCLQRIWLSFFFDGTGNNIDADEGTLKHSNVARLYNVHKADAPAEGVYRIYIPGVGTYFKDVGDDGGTPLGLVMAKMGERRLAWAMQKFDDVLAPHLSRAMSPATRIVEVNVAVFGFSRGAALARAFVNRLVSQRGVKVGLGWTLQRGGAPLKIRFMGLFDTVASVGLTLSSNNTAVLPAAIGGGHLAMLSRLRNLRYLSSRPEKLAFATLARPGADPAPGFADGHSAWGAEQAIPCGVECVKHFVAAHEIRNSFPVDSISILVDGKMAVVEHFEERVYPGAHSDVGGGYRPGEGGKSQAPGDKLSQIPLNHMYKAALENGVPLLPKTAWSRRMHGDFEIGPTLSRIYNYYRSQLPSASALGDNVNASMRLCYAWRFSAIRRKMDGKSDEAQRVYNVDRVYSEEAKALDAEIRRLELSEGQAVRAQNQAYRERTTYLQGTYGAPAPSLQPYDEAVDAADKRRANAHDALLKAKAKRDTLPDMSGLNAMIGMYDRQLIEDVQAIRREFLSNGVLSGAPNIKRRAELRPHYKALIETYEDEFIHNRGLKDEKLFAFFEHYVHDSLSGFAKDATLPSDPRVIYLGGDEKYRYAHNGEQRNDETGRQYASTEADDKLAQSA